MSSDAEVPQIGAEISRHFAHIGQTIAELSVRQAMQTDFKLGEKVRLNIPIDLVLTQCPPPPEEGTATESRRRLPDICPSCICITYNGNVVTWPPGCRC